MLTIRKSNDRGHANHGWLDTHYTFSFSDYYDPNFIRFKSIRVINEDIIQAGGGFGTHPHENMEILTYVISGSLAHKDSMGNGRTIKAGELQVMSAGTGIEHSEYNASNTEAVHLIQIWIIPNKKGIEPRYEEWKPTNSNSEFLTLLASPTKENNSVLINQEAYLYYGQSAANNKETISFSKYKNAWLQMINGTATCNKLEILQGDGVAIHGEEKIELEFKDKSKFLLFELN